MSCPFSGKGAGRPGAVSWSGRAAPWRAPARRLWRAPRRQSRQAKPALREPFFGPHQGGIATPQQTHSYFAAFDCLAKSRDELKTMLRVWTDAAARMSAGETARELGQDVSVEGPDGGSALGLAPGRLTITFGFGAGLFVKDGADRYGLAAKRPAALVDLPKFNGDQLDPRKRGRHSFRRAPTIRRSPSTPSGSWPACSLWRAELRWARQAFCRRRRQAKRRGT